MTAQDRHLTTEQLSAYLDDALSVEEQAQCEAHLHSCERCQQALATLRETVTLLHALPQPALPRSFLLTEKMLSAAQSEAELPRAVGAVPRALAERRATRGWSRATLTAMRSLTALAAVLGLVFLLSSFSFQGEMNGTATSSQMSSNTSSGSASSAAKAPATGLSPHAAQGEHTPAATPSFATAQPTPTSVPSYVSTNNNPTSGAAQPWLDLSNPGTRALLGLFLLLLALLGMLLLRRQRQMTRAG